MRGSSKGFAQVIIVIILLALVGGAIYYLDVQKGKPTSTSDVAANWKMYTNLKYSYTLKYPKNWNINYYEYNEGNNHDLETLAAPYLKGPCGENLNFECQINIQTINLKELAEKNSLIYNEIKDLYNPKPNTINNRIADIEEIYINRIRGISYDELSLFPDPKNDKWEHIIAVDKDNIRYKLSLYPDGEGRVIFDQILSTFKFTN